MLKKSIYVLVIAITMMACNSAQKKSSEKETTAEKLAKVEVASFNKEAVNYVNQKVEITAFVKHVCKHGGQRMFLADSESDESVKVIVGKGAAFNTDLEGKTIHLIGMVEELRIDEKYLEEWENELKAEEEHEKSEAEHDGEEHAHGEKAAAADLGQHIGDEESIANFRKQIKESGKAYISFFSIVCESFKEVDPA